MKKGRIIKLIGGLYTVMDLETNDIIEAKARGKLRFMKLDKNSSFLKSKTKRNTSVQTIKLSPKVGDFVTYELNDGINYITDIYERKNSLIRPDVSNVDQIILIFSCVSPNLSYTLLDRFLVLLDANDIDVVVVISKIDLVSIDELQQIQDKMHYYEKNIKIKVFYVNSLDKLDDDVKSIFKDKVSILSGQSGVGKSSFINALIPGFSLRTQETSQALGRGKHTTRCIELYQYNGGLIGDTPGFGSLELYDMHIEDLPTHFKDFKQYHCKYRGCMHLKEPGCRVKEAVLNGDILPSRYESYKLFIEEVKEIKKY